jgi:hypothetical protein
MFSRIFDKDVSMDTGLYLEISVLPHFYNGFNIEYLGVEERLLIKGM